MCVCVTSVVREWLKHGTDLGEHTHTHTHKHIHVHVQAHTYMHMYRYRNGVGTSVQKEKVHCNVTCNFYSNKSYNLTSLILLDAVP